MFHNYIASLKFTFHYLNSLRFLSPLLSLFSISMDIPWTCYPLLSRPQKKMPSTVSASHVVALVFSASATCSAISREVSLVFSRPWRRDNFLGALVMACFNYEWRSKERDRSCMILMLRHVTAYMVGHLVLSTDAGFFLRDGSLFLSFVHGSWLMMVLLPKNGALSPRLGWIQWDYGL